MTTEPNQTNQPQTPDNSTLCHNTQTVTVGFSGIRKHTSIRMDSNLWKGFKTVCEKNGLSTCDILEKLVLGFTVGYEMRVAQPTTINVLVDAPRLVKRVRRRALMFEDEVVVSEDVSPCYFCGSPAVVSARDFSGRKMVCQRHFDLHRADFRSWKVLKP